MRLPLLVAVMALLFGNTAMAVDINMSDYGIKPDRKENQSAKLQKALQKIKKKYNGTPVTLNFQKGKYNFLVKGTVEREYFISNHSQMNPRTVGFPIEDWNDVTIDGNGADFYFSGHTLPVALVRSERVTLRNFSVDFETPQIAQIEVVSNDGNGVVWRPAPWVKFRIGDDGKFYNYGDGWEIQTPGAIAFDGKTRHIVYRTSDIWNPVDSVVKVDKDLYRSPKWTDSKMVPGTVVALRWYHRPAAGIFVDECKDTQINNVKVHYCEGMGLIAQMTENITLDGFGVCLRGDDDPRYFTSNADATHFSACKGKIVSVNGLYEGMMDDAINVHGSYLRIVERKNESTVVGRYLSPGYYGFKWGEVGDSVKVIRSRTMENLDSVYAIKSITPVDMPTYHGAKDFEIVFNAPLPKEVECGKTYGLENITWTPEVYFAGNTIRNNRARGTLFSTPRRTIVENNLFDHTSGTAILLCGDCNGWYETGACRDVIIRNNRFVNSLTNMFQFTEAVISIYPEIPELWRQVKYFHGGEGHEGVVIENNVFETFDNPILYAKSIDGLRFKGNKIIHNHDFPAFHQNRFTFKLERAVNVTIEDNDFSGEDPSFYVK